MTLKQYRLLSAIVTLAAVAASAAIGTYLREQLVLGLALMFVAVVYILSIARKKITETVEDERDKEISGRAATMAILSYAGIMLVIALSLVGFTEGGAHYLPIALNLMDSTFVLLFTYSLIYQYNARLKFADSLVIFSAITLIYFIYRFISGLLLL